MEMIIPAPLDEIVNGQHIKQAWQIFILFLSAKGTAGIIRPVGSFYSLSLMLASGLIAWFGLKAK